MNTHSLPHSDTPDKPQNDRHVPPFVRLQWAIHHALESTPPGELDATGRNVVMAIAMHLNDRGEAYVSQSRIAARVGKSERTLRRVLASLHDGGWLVVTPGDGRGRMTTYAVGSRVIAAQKADAAMSAFTGAENGKKADISSKKADISSIKVDTAPEKSVAEPYNPKNNPKGVKGESPNGGGVGNAAKNHDAAPATNGASLPEELRAAWLATFGELTDKQAGFMRNAIKEHGAEALAATISAAHEYQRTTGKRIAKPAGFVGRKLQAAAGTPGATAPDYGFLAKNAPRPAQAGDTGADWGAIAADTTTHRQPAPEAAETAPAGASAPAHRTAPQDAAKPAERAPAGKPGRYDPANPLSAWDAILHELHLERDDANIPGSVGSEMWRWLADCTPIIDGETLLVKPPSNLYMDWASARLVPRLNRKLRAMTFRTPEGAPRSIRFAS